MAKRVLALILTLAMAFGLATNAAASTAYIDDAEMNSDAPNADNSDTATEAAKTDVTYAETSYQYLYWTDITLNPEPEIIYDTGLEQYYLRYRLSDACKLTSLLQTFSNEFKVCRNLDDLVRMNDIERIREPITIDGKSIYNQLTKSTKAILASLGETDAYTACQVIALLDRNYAENDTFGAQVRYLYASIKNVRSNLYCSLRALTNSNSPEPSVLEANPKVVIALAQQYIDENSSRLAILEEIYELVLAGKTSKYLTTFEMLAAEKVSALYAEVCEAWGEHFSYMIERLDAACIAVPLTEEALQQWLDNGFTVVTSVTQPMPTTSAGE